MHIYDYVASYTQKDDSTEKLFCNAVIVADDNEPLDKNSSAAEYNNSCLATSGKAIYFSETHELSPKSPD